MKLKSKLLDKYETRKLSAIWAGKPRKSKCCICKTRLTATTHKCHEDRPTGTGGKLQRWWYCMDCVTKHSIVLVERHEPAL